MSNEAPAPAEVLWVLERGPTYWALLGVLDTYTGASLHGRKAFVDALPGAVRRQDLLEGTTLEEMAGEMEEVEAVVQLGGPRPESAAADRIER